MSNTRKKTDVEVAKARLLKAVRTAVRLSHAVAADAELNDVLPDVEAQFDQMVLRGKLPEDAVEAVFQKWVRLSG